MSCRTSAVNYLEWRVAEGGEELTYNFEVSPFIRRSFWAIKFAY